MRVLLMGLFAFSMVGCATTGAADATAKAAKVGCCAQAKAEGKACEKCAAKKAAVGDKAKKECCVQAAASGPNKPPVRDTVTTLGVGSTPSTTTMLRSSVGNTTDRNPLAALSGISMSK